MLGIPVTGSDTFAMVGFLGFHPADERSPAGTVVPYHRVPNVNEVLEKAMSAGFALVRGPLTLEDVTIAQLQDKTGLRIGLISKA